MFSILCFSSAILLVHARPDVSLGYNYMKPSQSSTLGTTLNSQTSHSPPQQQTYLPPIENNLLGTDNRFSVSGSPISNQYVPAPSTSTTKFEQPACGTLDYTQAITSNNYNPAQNYSSPQNFNSARIYNSIPNNNNVPFGSSNFNQVIPSSTNYNLPRTSNGQQTSTNQETNTVHFYTGEDEHLPPRRIVISGNATPNHHTIFVKAPSYVQSHVVVPQNHQQVEERTKVYVLVKRPEEQGPIVVPQASRTIKSKPEVVFIKYRDQQEAERQISDSLRGSGSNGDLATAHDDGRSFVGALGRDSSASSPEGATNFREDGKQSYLPPSRL